MDLGLPDLGRSLVAVPADDPLPVVRLLEFQQGQPQVLDRVEAPDPEQILLEGAHEALRDAVALRLPHEGRRAFRTGCRGRAATSGPAPVPVAARHHAVLARHN